MLALLLKRFIIQRIKAAMFKKIVSKVLESKVGKGYATGAGAATLAIGAVAGAFGIDLAPTEVDLIVSFGALVVTIIGRLRAAHQAAQ